MNKLMYALFKKRRQAWAPKFLLALEANEHLSWLVQKIQNEMNKGGNKSDTTDTVNSG